MSSISYHLYVDFNPHRRWRPEGRSRSAALIPAKRIETAHTRNLANFFSLGVHFHGDSRNSRSLRDSCK